MNPDQTKNPRKLPVGRLSARLGHAVAPHASGLMLFGGIGNGGILNDTQVFRNGFWQEKFPSVAPFARSDHAMASIGTRVVLFGGHNGQQPLNDTWEWDGTVWVQKNPAHKPSARSGHAMAPLNGKVILFGGRGTAGELADTWQWDGIDWVRMPTSDVPEARTFARMIEFPAGKLLLFGGAAFSYATVTFNDTWQFDGDWRPLNPSQSPEPRFQHSLTQCGATAVLFGGMSLGPAIQKRQWQWDGAAWTPITVKSGPVQRTGSAGATIGAEALIVGGRAHPFMGWLGDTWSWDGSRWGLKNSGEVPALKYFSRNAYASTPNQNVAAALGSAFTVESWIYFPEFVGSARVSYYPIRVGGVVVLEITDSQTPGKAIVSGHQFVNGNQYASSIAVVDQQLLQGGWHHIACESTHGGPVAIYIDGIRQSGVTGQMSASYSSELYIGYLPSPTDGKVFEQAELRLSSIVRYGANFTPLPFGARHEVDANTAGLWHFGDGYGARSFQDSAGRFRLVAAGDAELGPAS